MTSLCKNASSGWLPSRAPGKGGGKKGLGACQPPAALASSNFIHLRITPDKFLNFSGLQPSHLYSERPDLGVARSPSCWESPRLCDSSSSSLRGPLGCRCTREFPTHTGAQGWGLEEEESGHPAQLGHTEAMAATKVFENRLSSCRTGHRSHPPTQFLSWSGVW